MFNVAFNIFAGGTCLEHPELRRNDEAYLRLLDTERKLQGADSGSGSGIKAGPLVNLPVAAMDAVDGVDLSTARFSEPAALSLTYAEERMSRPPSATIRRHHSAQTPRSDSQ